MTPSAPVLTECQLRKEIDEAGLAGENRIETALKLVKLNSGHGGRERIGGGSVLEEHIYPVSLLVLRFSKTLSREQIILRFVAALCHDLEEDTEIKLPEIKAQLGNEIARLVELLSDVGKTVDSYFTELAKDSDAIVIKVCDRLNNLQCAHKISDKKIVLEFCEETVKYVIPLAKKVSASTVNEMLKMVAQLRQHASV